MSVTYLMSPPGPDWHIRGGENFVSRARPRANPRAALKEWIALADAITRAGGHILVMPAPTVDPPLTGLCYTANAGQLFRSGDQAVYLLSQMAAPHRQPERDFVRAFAAEAGLAVRVAAHRWEGQADLQLVGGNRYLYTYGARTSRDAAEDVRALLPPNARMLELELAEPFQHGDLALCPMANRAGDEILLAHGAALAAATVEAVRQFVGGGVEVLAIDRDDALAFACGALCVHGTALVPRGVSAAARGQIARRGFAIEEIDLPELMGKGGGGPRSLVNELRGLVLTPGAPDYGSRRDELTDRLDQYPEEAPPAVTAG